MEIEDAGVPLAAAPEDAEEIAEDVDQKTDGKEIDENKVPLAAPIEEDGFNWWWLIAVAVVIIGGVVVYNENKKRQTAKAELQDNQKQNQK